MAFNLQAVWNQAKRRGPRVAVIAVVSALVSGTVFGVIEAITSGFVPRISRTIVEYMWTPHVIVEFTEPVKITRKDLQMWPITDAERNDPVLIRSFNSINEKLYTIQTRVGQYQIRLTKEQHGIKYYLSTMLEFETSGQKWMIDTAERNWVSDNAIRKEEFTEQGVSMIEATRWVLSHTDFEGIDTVTDPKLQSIAAIALSQVGIREDGTSYDHEAINKYWSAVPAFPRDLAKETTPWQAAFVSWVVMVSGDNPPPSSAATHNWLEWGSEVPESDAVPGTIVIFQVGEEHPIRRRLFIGVFLRHRAGCIEVVAGNTYDRVAIRCVTYRALAFRQPSPV